MNNWSVRTKSSNTFESYVFATGTLEESRELFNVRGVSRVLRCYGLCSGAWFLSCPGITHWPKLFLLGAQNQVRKYWTLEASGCPLKCASEGYDRGLVCVK